LHPPADEIAPAALIDDRAPEVPWNPSIRRLYDYSRRIAPPGRLPGRQHFDPVEVPDLLRGIWIVEVARNPFRLRYRLVGTRVVDALGFDPTGMWLDDAHPRTATTPAFFARYEKVAENGIPSRRRGPATLWTDKDHREIENILLPLAADGRNVDMIVVLTAIYRLDGTEVR